MDNSFVLLVLYRAKLVNNSKNDQQEVAYASTCRGFQVQFTLLLLLLHLSTCTLLIIQSAIAHNAIQFLKICLVIQCECGDHSC